MSTEEQDQIHGRLLRERGESRRRVAAFGIKLRDAGGVLRHVAAIFDDLSKTGWTDSPQSARLHIENVPGQAELLSLLDEAVEEQRKLRDIEKQLAEFEQ